MLLLIDNFDSFTFNLLHGLASLGRGLHIEVVRSDAITPRRAAAMKPTAIVVSPGPCGPKQAGASMPVIRALAGRVPILGVCLGHQCLGEAFGMRVIRHHPVHGKTTAIAHDGRGLFSGLPRQIEVMRYHSLVVDPASIGDGWEVSAWSDERSSPDHACVVMGLRRAWPAGAAHNAPLDGVQFHPESFMTPQGPRILGNFLRQARRWHVGGRRGRAAAHA